MRDIDGRPVIVLFVEESCGYVSTHNIRPTSAAADFQVGLRVMVDTLRARNGGAPEVIYLRMRSRILTGPGVQQALVDLRVERIVDDLEPFMVRPNGDLWMLRNLFDLVRQGMGTLNRPDDSTLRYEYMYWAQIENWVHGGDGISSRERLFGLRENRPMYLYRAPVIAIAGGLYHFAEFLCYSRDYEGCIVLVSGMVEFVMQVWPVAGGHIQLDQ